MGGLRGSCEKNKCAYRVSVGGNMVEIGSLDDLGSKGRIIFACMLTKIDDRA